MFYTAFPRIVTFYYYFSYYYFIYYYYYKLFPHSFINYYYYNFPLRWITAGVMPIIALWRPTPLPTTAATPPTTAAIRLLQLLLLPLPSPTCSKQLLLFISRCRNSSRKRLLRACLLQVAIGSIFFFFFFWGTLFLRKLYLKNFNIKNKEIECSLLLQTTWIVNFSCLMDVYNKGWTRIINWPF